MDSSIFSTASVSSTSASSVPSCDFSNYVRTEISSKPPPPGKMWAVTVRCTGITAYDDEEVDKEQVKKDAMARKADQQEKTIER